jgi:hypothetical protein
MRLLFDEQLSDALPALLDDVFPGSVHVRALVGVGASDERVWELAIEHGCILVSKDEDFHRLSVLRGAPPRSSGSESATARRTQWLPFCAATSRICNPTLIMTKRRSWHSDEEPQPKCHVCKE